MENDKIIQKDESKINTDEYYYYLSPSQSMNFINTLSISQNLKNLEPQDNVKKAKQRQLLEVENKLKNIQNKFSEENLQKINNDDYLNYDIKSFTAVKVNKTNRIFQNGFSDNYNKNNFYQINFVRKTKDDDNILSKNKNKNSIDNNYIYEKKNITNIKKLNSENLDMKLNENENNEREPMDNIRKKFEKNKQDIEIRKKTYDLMVTKQIINEKDLEQNNKNINISEEIINKNENEIENEKVIENNDLTENNNQEIEYNNIIKNDNIVFRDIKDLKNKNNEENSDENAQISNNKLEIINETKNIEENQKEPNNEDNGNINNFSNNENNLESDKEKNEEEKIINKEEGNKEENKDKNESNQNNENEIIIEKEKKENIVNNIINEETEEKIAINKNEENNDDKYLNKSQEENQNLENIKEVHIEEKENNETNDNNINIIKENNEQKETEINSNIIDNNPNFLNINDNENNKNKIEIINQENFIIKSLENISKPEKTKKKRKLIKNYSKQNISKINIINLDFENENEKKINKERERFFSSKDVKKTPKLNEKQKIKEIYNIKNEAKNKSRMIYRISKNISENSNNPKNSTNKSVQKNPKKSKHKLINRIRSINISSKHLNFSNKKDHKFNSFSPNILQKQNNKRSLVKNYSQNNLNKIWDKIFHGNEYNIKKDLNEVNENEEIHYYDPGSIIKYSFNNFNNKNYYNKKFFSQSVKKENNNSESRFNNILNNTINTLNKSLSKFIFFNFSNNEEQKKEENFSKRKKEINVNKLKENIDMKNKDIERIKKLIKNAKNEIQKVDSEIRKIDSWIKKEDSRNENLIYFLNFFNINKDN